MKKKYFILFLFILISTCLHSQNVTVNSAKKIVYQHLSSKGVSVEIMQVDTIFSKKKSVLGYLIKLSPKGFVVTSADRNINPIIAYSIKNNCSIEKLSKTFIFDDLKLREKYITKNRLYNQIDKWELYDKNKSKNKSNEAIVEPLLTSNWFQSGPYNKYCPIDPDSGERSMVGCVTTATSQILNYWKYPTSIKLIDGDSYISKGKNGDISIPEDSDKYSFPNFTTINQNLSTIDYNSMDEISLLNFSVGIKNHMNYSSGGSATFMDSKIFLDLGYGSAELNKWNDETKGVVIENLKKGWPAQVSLRITGKRIGHSVVFDGYDPNTEEFHVNLGWGLDPNDTWYLPPNIIDYNIMSQVVYNICPKQSWNQMGVDAQNTRRTTYNIPEQNKSKWSVSTRNDYSYNGLIIGNGSNVIASCSPNSQYSNTVSFVFFYSKKGDFIDRIDLNGTPDGISSPVQSQNGDIYVTSDHGKIYKINQKLKEAKLIFEEPYGTEITWGLKIDKTGNLYVGAWDKFYCLNSEGTIKWSKFLGQNQFWVGQPSVDDVNGYVIYQYYNGPNTNIGTYECYDIETGNVLKTKNFSITSSNKIGTASISSNGTAYFGIQGKLYSWNPLKDEFKTIIVTDGISTSSPAIGINGNLYLWYWKGNDLMLGSVNPVNNLINWEQMLSQQDYDWVKSIYTDGFGHICLTLHKENGFNSDTHYVSVFKDKVNSVDLLWSDYYAFGEGETFLGPDKTMYLAQNNKISAISETKNGESFSNYLDNNKPDKPQLLSPKNNSIFDTLKIDFSWSGTDSDNQILTYDFYIGDSEEMMTLFKENLTVTNITVSDLIPGTTYLWNVVAKDGQSDNQSETNTFKIVQDNDGDGVSNTDDNCPNTPTGETPDTNGCSASQLDDDNDGIMNNTDQCLNTPQPIEGITVAGGNGAGSAANQLYTPLTIFVDIYNNIYITDNGYSRIQKWTPGATEGITVAGGNGAGSAANQLQTPWDVFVDLNENIYIADIGNDRIQKWALDATEGITVAGGNGRGSASNQFSTPAGIFVDLEGNIYVTDQGNNRIQKWALGATEGITVAGGNGYGSAANQFKSPTGIFVDLNRNIYIADRGNNRIQKWSLGAVEGVTVANQLNDVGYFFVDIKGNIYVAERGNNRIQKWRPGVTEGITVAGGNGVGSATNQFDLPSDVFVDLNRNIYVVDTNNNRVQKWLSTNVDVFGCEVFNLPANNYEVKVTSASCIGSTNGSISTKVTDTNYIYTVSVTGQEAFTLDPGVSDTKIFEGLPRGTYTVCFTIDGKENYEQCFEVNIEEPAPITAASSFNPDNNILSLDLSGSIQYDISINGEIQQFKGSKFSTTLKNGLNQIRVGSSLACQRPYIEEIFISDEVLYYPNPTEDLLNLYISDTKNDMSLYIRNLGGVLVIFKNYKANTNIHKTIDLSNLPQGSYLISLEGKTISKTFKIIKK